jgi:FkbM family methyltransferase
MISDEKEQRLIREFFGARSGYFVEVGANHPTDGSQSCHLEVNGWHGILIEPQPDVAKELARLRRAKVFAVACTSPRNAGQRLPFCVAGKTSALDRDRMAPGAIPEAIIEVEARTLDDVLREAGAPQPIDFVSIDVEGHEIEVLQGFDVNRWAPRLILLEDHVGDLNRHRFMKSIGYRLIRRTGYNGWYVPANAAISPSWSDRARFLRKYYLALPFRILRNASRRIRQPYKDRRTLAARDRG